MYISYIRFWLYELYCNTDFLKTFFPFADINRKEAMQKKPEAVPGTKYTSNVFIVNKYNILYIVHSYI